MSLFSSEHHKQTRLFLNTARSEGIVLCHCTAKDTSLKKALRTCPVVTWTTACVSCLYTQMVCLKEIKPILLYFSNFYDQNSFWKHLSGLDIELDQYACGQECHTVLGNTSSLRLSEGQRDFLHWVRRKVTVFSLPDSWNVQLLWLFFLYHWSGDGHLE